MVIGGASETACDFWKNFNPSSELATVIERLDLPRTLPLAILVGIGSIGWIAEVRRTSRYSMTSSARARIDGGIASPNPRAAFKLTIRSNLVGCSTGRSAGFVPLGILSTKRAA